MNWLLSNFACFIEDPYLTLLPAGFFALLAIVYLASWRGKGPGKGVLLTLVVVTAGWISYFAWESSMSEWTKSLPPGPIIRVDLLLIAIVLPILSLLGFSAFIYGLLSLRGKEEPALRPWQDPGKPKA